MDVTWQKPGVTSHIEKRKHKSNDKFEFEFENNFFLAYDAV
jgi:hypothetical protein